MTACVNKKHTRRVALAISASLVGALSLGAAAPAVAFAANDGIQTMDASKQQSIFGNVNYMIDFDNVFFHGSGFFSISVLISVNLRRM